MSLTFTPFVFPALALCFTLCGTALLLPLLRRARVLDAPNERSNHAVPVPRGGGLAMTLSMLLFLAASGLPLPVAFAGALLALVSLADDVRGLSVRLRLLAQILAVAVAVQALPGRVLPAFVPLPVEWALLGLAWLWFINLTNFMDGIDAITAMETIMITLGIVFVRLLAPHLPHAPQPLLVQASVVGASALGFLAFNRPPAKLFMGDVGSIPLGFLLGYLLLSLAGDGYWAAALILPAYYLADATSTLLRRLLRREKIWQAHSQHAYQQAVRAGESHGRVVARIACLNLVLVVLAMLARPHMIAAIALLFAAYFLAARLIIRFTNAPSS